MKLKRRKRGEDRDPIMCAASRCTAESTILLSTKELDGCDVPLCDAHWQQHCDEQDAKHAAEVKRIRQLTNPTLPPGLEPGEYKVQFTKDLQLEVIS